MIYAIIKKSDFDKESLETKASMCCETMQGSSSVMRNNIANTECVLGWEDDHPEIDKSGIVVSELTEDKCRAEVEKTAWTTNDI